MSTSVDIPGFLGIKFPEWIQCILFEFLKSMLVLGWLKLWICGGVKKTIILNWDLLTSFAHMLCQKLILALNVDLSYRLYR